MKNRDIEFYIENAKQRAGIKSNSDLSHALGLSRGAITQFNTRRAFPSDETMTKIADLAGIDPAIALIDLSIWRTAGQAAKTYAAILQKIMAVVLIAVSLIGFSNSPAQAKSKMEVTNNIYYGK